LTSRAITGRVPAQFAPVKRGPRRQGRSGLAREPRACSRSQSPENVWTLERRNRSGLLAALRFTGTFSDDCNTIFGRWESGRPVDAETRVGGRKAVPPPTSSGYVRRRVSIIDSRRE
jgi:hypothetical protein